MIRELDGTNISYLTVFFYVMEQIIFDFRFLALLAVGGSLAGSLLCFLNVTLLFFNLKCSDTTTTFSVLKSSELTM